MMRYIVFIAILVGGLWLSSGAFSSGDAASTNQATVLGSMVSLSDSVVHREVLKEEALAVSYDKAFDLREGSSAFFDGMEIAFDGLDMPEEGCEDYDCHRADLRLSTSGAEENKLLVEGEEVQWEGYAIKLSQVAPKENKGGVPYRAVILVSAINK